MKHLFVKLLGILVFTLGTTHRVRTRLQRSHSDWFQLYAEVSNIRDRYGLRNSLCVYTFFSGDESYWEMGAKVINLLHALKYRVMHRILMEHSSKGEK